MKSSILRIMPAALLLGAFRHTNSQSVDLETPADFSFATAVRPEGTGSGNVNNMFDETGTTYFSPQQLGSVTVNITFNEPTLLTYFRCLIKNPSSQTADADSTTLQNAFYIHGRTGEVIDLPKDDFFGDPDFASDNELITWTFLNNNDGTVQLHASKFGFQIAVSNDLDYYNFTRIDLQGDPGYTAFPTQYPTKAPTKEPTPNPTMNPTTPPTPAPTGRPSRSPTGFPTPGPTWDLKLGKTLAEANGERPFTIQYSENIYPLIERNQTYATFTVPRTCKTKTDSDGNEYEQCSRTPYCATCVLAYSEIDVLLTLPNCSEVSTELRPTDDDQDYPSPYYFCESDWKMVSTARLVEFQQTYGRVEVWEIDEHDVKWRQTNYEFQWNTSLCIWNDSGTFEKCDLLPLTGGRERTARLEFTMPKRSRDPRTRPLIVVWYDLLNVPYALRPSLNYTFTNYTPLEVEEGQNFGVNDLRNEPTFTIPIYSACALFGLFSLITLASCCRIDHRSKKSQMMLDTRNLREVFMHKRDWLVTEEENIKNRSRFKCHKHGPYLLIVFLARVAYMTLFTFYFYGLTIQAMTKRHFDTIDQYEAFARDRDAQLTNISSNLEQYYYNETNRMDREVESRQFWCYTAWINQSSDEFDQGSYDQFVYHSEAMIAPLKYVALNLSDTAVSYQEGSTACSILNQYGAEILQRDVIVLGVNTSAGSTFQNTENNGTNGSASLGVETVKLVASKWSRSWSNWTEGVYDVVNAYCLGNKDCAGWTWIDETESTNASFVLLKTLADPINDLNVSGTCYVMQRYDDTGLSFDNLNNLQNVSDQLEAEYLAAYQLQSDDLLSAANGLWNALQDIDDSSNVIWTVNVNRDPSRDFESDVDWQSFGCEQNDAGDPNCTFYMVLTINCPDCPAGNFTNPVLNQVFDYIGDTTYNEEEGFVNDANVSDLVSVTTPKLEAPDIPTIDLPLDVKWPFSFAAFFSVSVALDTLMLIYRWWKTAALMSTVIRGRDNEINIRSLMLIKPKVPVCCPRDARSAADSALTSIMCVDKFCKGWIYEFWKFGYWVTLFLGLACVIGILTLAYYLIDQILRPDFIEALGIFDLLTVGLAAQRAVRNEVICTTAASYNNFTLYQMTVNRDLYAAEKNALALDWNRQEVQRVDEWNAYFCQVWGQYQATVRDVTVDLGGRLSYETSNNLGVGSEPENLFDKNFDTQFVPFPVDSEAASELTTTVSIYIELPVITMRETTNLTRYWNVDFLQFFWAFNTSDAQNAAESVSYQIFYKLDESDSAAWIPGNTEFTSYSHPEVSDGSESTIINEMQQINVMGWNETRFIRIDFENAGTWANDYLMNEITVYGNVPPEEIVCPFVEFRYWYYDANDVTTLYCPVISPIFGYMYRGFVRDWLVDELFDAHRPFINAMRNIALSPFFLAIVMLAFLLMFSLLGFFLEWFLRLVDLYRENAYAKIPLVTSEDEDYDPMLHELEQFEAATIGVNYYRPTEMLDGDTLAQVAAGIPSMSPDQGPTTAQTMPPATNIYEGDPGYTGGPGTSEAQTYHYGDPADIKHQQQAAMQQYQGQSSGAPGEAPPGTGGMPAPPSTVEMQTISSQPSWNPPMDPGVTGAPAPGAAVPPPRPPQPGQQTHHVQPVAGYGVAVADTEEPSFSYEDFE